MPPTSLPSEPIDRIVGPLARFLHVEAASGVVLLAAAVAAFALANSPLADSFLGIWKTRVSFGFGGFQLDHSLQHWVSDGLMAIFFFVVGLEVKRELVLGQLRDMRKAALPIAAALGGMLFDIIGDAQLPIFHTMARCDVDNAGAFFRGRIIGA